MQIKPCKNNYKNNQHNTIIKINFYNNNKLNYKKRLIMINNYYNNIIMKR